MIFASQEARCYHNGRWLALLYKEGCVRTLRFRKGGGAIMMIEYITLAGFVLQVIVVGIAIGRYAEKIDRFIRRFDDEEHNDTNKNNRR